MPEYFIKEIKNQDPNNIYASGQRYGLYYDSALIGYYPNYQRARADLINMRDQQAHANEWFRPISNMYTMPGYTLSTASYGTLTINTSTTSNNRYNLLLG